MYKKVKLKVVPTVKYKFEPCIIGTFYKSEIYSKN